MPRKTFTFEGKRYSVSAATEIELGKKMALKQQALEEGSILYSSATTVKKWSEEYVEVYRRPGIEDNTYKYLMGYLHNYIIPEIGNLKLKDVKAIHLQKIVNQCEGMSYSQCNKLVQLLRGMFTTAFNNQMIKINPTLDLRLPGCEDDTHRSITDRERALTLIVAETHEYGLWVLIMLFCGLRPSETKTVLGCHIDRKTSLLYIDGTKSKTAKRYVPIPGILMSKLPPIAPYDYLFTQKTTGRPITKTSMRGMWKSFKRAMNIQAGCRVFRNELVPPFPVAEDLCPYCYRHTFCTDLQDAGVPINIAKDLMGHSNISTTAKYYTHLTNRSMLAAAEKINDYHDNNHTTDIMQSREFLLIH